MSLTAFSPDVTSKLKAAIQKAIKSKLEETDAFVDDELPEYIMVMIANKKDDKHMQMDLALFLGENTNSFVKWLFQHLDRIKSEEKQNDAPKPEIKKAAEKPLKKKQPPPKATTSTSRVAEEQKEAAQKRDREQRLENEKKVKAEREQEERKLEEERERQYEKERVRVEKIRQEERERRRQNKLAAQPKERSRSRSPVKESEQSQQKKVTSLRRSPRVSADKAKPVSTRTVIYDVEDNVNMNKAKKKNTKKNNQNETKTYPKMLIKALSAASESTSRDVTIGDTSTGSIQARKTQIKNTAAKRQIVIKDDFEEELDYRELEDGSPTMTVTVKNTQPTRKAAKRKNLDTDDWESKKPVRAVKITRSVSRPTLDTSDDEAAIDELLASISTPAESTTVKVVPEPAIEKETEPVQNKEVTAARTVERCKYWPKCRSGESCPFAHPSKACKSFPKCPFGQKCLYIHPPCRFGSNCRNTSCAFTHGGKVTAQDFGKVAIPEVVSTVVPSKTADIPLATPALPDVQPPTVSTTALNTQCHFGGRCKNPNCTFRHPPMCRFGASCFNPNCSYYHGTKAATTHADPYKWSAGGAPA